MSNVLPRGSNTRNFLLINRNFALLWGGQAISQIGDFAFGTTIVLWIATVLAKNQSWAPLAISGDLLSLSIPMFTIAPFAGVFVDRWDKRQTMLWMDVLRAAFILLLFLTATIAAFFPGARLPVFWQLGCIYAVIFLTSTCSLFFNPARFALLAGIVSEQDRPRATGLTQLSVNVAVIVGPLIATVLFFSVGIEWALLLNALSFVISFVGIVMIRIKGPLMGMVPRPQGTVLDELREGISFFWRNRLLRSLVVTNVLFMTGAGALSALNIFFVTRNLHAPASFYGLLETAAGAGAIVGALIVITFAQRVGVARMFWLSMLGVGLFIVVYSRLDSFIPALIVTFLLGIPDAIFLASGGPIMMHATPRQFMGRVMSVFMPITSLAMITSTAVVGYLASTTLVSFHATLFGITFGPLDAIFTAIGFIIIAGGVYALIRLRGVHVVKPMMRPGPMIVERPRDGVPGPMMVERPRDGVPGPMIVERPRDGVPGPMMVERSRDGVPGPMIVERPRDGVPDMPIVVGKEKRFGPASPEIQTSIDAQEG